MYMYLSLSIYIYIYIYICMMAGTPVCSFAPPQPDARRPKRAEHTPAHRGNGFLSMLEIGML